MSCCKIIFLILFFVFYLNPIFPQVSEEDLITSIEKFKNENNKPATAATLNKLAYYYWEMGKPEKALAAFELSVAVNMEIDNQNAIKAIYSNMGMIHSELGQMESALVFFRKSLLISNTQQNKQDIVTNLINIGTALMALDRNNEAVENLTNGLTVALELQNKKLLQACYEILSEAYSKVGDSQKSMEYFNLFTTFHKEVLKEEEENAQKKSLELVAKAEQKAKIAIQEKLETEQKLYKYQDSLKISEELNQIKELEILKKKAELKSQRFLTLMLIIGLGSITALALLILRSNRQKKRHNNLLEHRNAEIKKQNKEIKAQNLQITQSINYARNIQGALLPEINSIKNIFCDSFIFFSPRDVVSGDFYWFTKIPGQEHLKMVAAIDCTGHGVPGAFMSMLGMSFLEEIVIDKGIHEPKDILEELHKMVKTSLNQEITGNFDGMDAAICLYDEKNKTLTFAGAVNPLVIIQNGVSSTIKGSFFGIGGTMKEAQSEDRKFEQQTLTIEVPTVCYIFTDGFSDQFGGENGKKFFSKNFINLLNSIYHLPFVEQKEILAETLRNWHGTAHPRVDDVLVIGFRL